MNLTRQSFRTINLADTFFASLKADYREFTDWFGRKALANDTAYVFQDDTGAIDGFLYLKIEDGVVADTAPPLPSARRVKVGTLKINAHGTKLGERFVKKIFDHAISEHVAEVYVTVFAEHDGLIALLTRYGFLTVATKTTENGVEQVLIKRMRELGNTPLQSYPLVQVTGRSIYLLSLMPQWHSRLLPDSILRNEDTSIIQDISHTNSIHKVYLAAMQGVQELRPGDVLLIYRTSDNQGPARYRSVATSICVVEEYRHISSFGSQEEFVNYCKPYSVFDERELADFWSRGRYPFVFRFTYNIALPKRVTRGVMLDECGLDESKYFGILRLTPQQFHNIVSRGQVDESLIVY
jgi:L-amino acid N-acyltransferase YncA